MKTLGAEDSSNDSVKIHAKSFSIGIWHISESSRTKGPQNVRPLGRVCTLLPLPVQYHSIKGGLLF